MTAPKLLDGRRVVRRGLRPHGGAALLQHRAAQPHRPSGALRAERGGRRRPADGRPGRRGALRRADGLPRGVRARAASVIWSAHLSALFRELPYLERPRRRGRRGVHGGRDVVARGRPRAGVGGRDARLGLDVSLVNCFGGDLDAGERGFLNVPGAARRGARRLPRRARPRRPLRRARDQRARRPRHAATSTARAQLATRGRHARRLRAARRGGGRDDRRRADQRARHARARSCRRPRAAAELVESVGSPSVRLLYDAYHAARAGSDPVPRGGRAAAADRPRPVRRLPRPRRARQRRARPRRVRRRARGAPVTRARSGSSSSPTGRRATRSGSCA